MASEGLGSFQSLVPMCGPLGHDLPSRGLSLCICIIGKPFLRNRRCCSGLVLELSCAPRRGGSPKGGDFSAKSQSL